MRTERCCEQRRKIYFSSAHINHIALGIPVFDVAFKFYLNERLVRETITAADGQEELITRAYDPDGNMLMANGDASISGTDAEDDPLASARGLDGVSSGSNM